MTRLFFLLMSLSVAVAQSRPAQPPAATQTAAAPQKKIYKPQSTQEYQAYQAAMDAVAHDGDPLKAETAVADFEKKFPQSDLRILLYQGLMDRFQKADNAGKAIDYGRKALALDGDASGPLLMVAMLLAESTHPDDAQRDAKYSEAVRDAQHALEVIDKNGVPNRTAAEVDAIRAMGYMAIGTVDFNRKNNQGAEAALRKATELNTLNPDAWAWYRLARALDEQGKYQEALAAVTKAAQYAGSDATIEKYSKDEQARLQQLAAAQPGKPASTPPPGAQPQGAQPPQGTAQPQ